MFIILGYCIKFLILLKRNWLLFIGNRLFELLKMIFIKVEITRGFVFFWNVGGKRNRVFVI